MWQIKTSELQEGVRILTSEPRKKRRHENTSDNQPIKSIEKKHTKIHEKFDFLGTIRPRMKKKSTFKYSKDSTKFISIP